MPMARVAPVQRFALFGHDHMRKQAEAFDQKTESHQADTGGVPGEQGPFRGEQDRGSFR